MQPIIKQPRNYLFMLTISILLCACDKGDTKQDSDNKASTPVTTMVTKIQEVDVSYKSVGNLIPKDAPVMKSRISGQVEEILIHEGEHVQKGQVLVKIKQEEMALQVQETLAKVMQADAQVDENYKSLSRAQKLINKGYISKERCEQIQAQLKTSCANLMVAKAELQRAKYQESLASLKSPINGQIGKVSVSVGEYVSQGAEVLNIVNHDVLEARLPFAEQKTSLISNGQKVILRSATNSNETLTSTVTAVTPDINPENRSINVLVIFDNRYKWKPGSSVNGQIFATPLHTIMVPADSIVTQQGKQVIFIVRNNKAYSQAVQTGYETDGWVAVTQGLYPGDVVVVSGADYLSNGIGVSEQNQGKAP